MTDATFHITKDQIRKPESHVSRAHKGRTPANSNVSAMKSIIDSNTDKPAEIDRAKANLPLPEQPPAASDLKSADQRTTGPGSGSVSGPVSGEGNSALREPATASSSVRIDGDEYKTLTEPHSGVGRQGHDNLDDLPKDAKAR
ncbi:hypothetical protein VTN49DRAFT_2886 [Thermomyces lanuginosus]|uniref:uncharacterized protein n=1 Tax=Thermomyces lanuginosus TaxID=5541 RepID=UPI0037436448